MRKRQHHAASAKRNADVEEMLRKLTELLVEIVEQIDAKKKRDEARRVLRFVLKQGAWEITCCVSKMRERSRALTKREEDVVSCLGLELGDEGIAKVLGVRKETVRKHLAHARWKLKVHTRAALLRTWLLGAQLEGAR